MSTKEGDFMFDDAVKTTVSSKLMEWLRQRWKYDNHPKYQHYFEEWLGNITQDQIVSFEKQMFNLENGVLGAKS